MWTHPVWSCNATDQIVLKTLQNYKVDCASIWCVNLGTGHYLCGGVGGFFLFYHERKNVTHPFKPIS